MCGRQRLDLNCQAQDLVQTSKMIQEPDEDALITLLTTTTTRQFSNLKSKNFLSKTTEVLIFMRNTTIRDHNSKNYLYTIQP